MVKKHTRLILREVCLPTVKQEAEWCVGKTPTFEGCFEGLNLIASIEFSGSDASLTFEINRPLVKGNCDKSINVNMQSLDDLIFNEGDVLDYDSILNYMISADDLADSLGYSSICDMEDSLGISLESDEISNETLDRILTLNTRIASKKWCLCFCKRLVLIRMLC